HAASCGFDMASSLTRPRAAAARWGDPPESVRNGVGRGGVWRRACPSSFPRRTRRRARAWVVEHALLDLPPHVFHDAPAERYESLLVVPVYLINDPQDALPPTTSHPLSAQSCVGTRDH